MNRLAAALATALAAATLTTGVVTAAAPQPEHVTCTSRWISSRSIYVNCSHGHAGVEFRGLAKAVRLSDMTQYTAYGDWEPSTCSACSSNISVPTGHKLLYVIGIQTR
jgi:hypothetical protein